MKPTWESHDGRVRLFNADCIDAMRSMPDESINCIVTSPPYWGLRDYGVDGQIGLEPTPEEYVAKMTEVFREARRVLRSDGTMWLNLGDSYAANRTYQVSDNKHKDVGNNMASKVPDGFKSKDLIGIPWRVAFALQSDGWYLRSDIIWSKPNPMPESVKDRPTKAHEYIFLMTKSARYWYDADAIKENSIYGVPNSPESIKSPYGQGYARRAKQRGAIRPHTGFNNRWDAMSNYEQRSMGRNKRSVWEVATEPFPEAHFATYPMRLIEPCILAGCPDGGVVYDPFTGSGTTALVALRLGRRFVGSELNQQYFEMAKRRIEPEANQVTIFDKPQVALETPEEPQQSDLFEGVKA